jgi:hypothetical protein
MFPQVKPLKIRHSSPPTMEGIKNGRAHLYSSLWDVPSHQIWTIPSGACNGKEIVVRLLSILNFTILGIGDPVYLKRIYNCSLKFSILVW